MRLVDADALIPMMKYSTLDNEIGVFPIKIGFDAIKGVIDDAPTIDAVEVVRCKDCIHYESDGGAMMICNVTDMVCDNDDYCSYGERKGGEMNENR